MPPIDDFDAGKLGFTGAAGEIIRAELAMRALGTRVIEAVGVIDEALGLTPELMTADLMRSLMETTMSLLTAATPAIRELSGFISARHDAEFGSTGARRLHS